MTGPRTTLRHTSLAVLAALCALASPAFPSGFEQVRMASGRTMNALPGQVIVRYRAGVTGEGQSRMAAMGASVRRSIPALNLDLVSVPKGQTVESFLAALKSNPDVEFAEPNGVMHALTFPASEPNDMDFDVQYALRYDSGGFPANINIGSAWAITLGDPSIVVAVVDTGADLNNPDFDTGSFVQGAEIEIDWENNGNCTDTPATDQNLTSVGPDQCAGTNPQDDNNINSVTGTVDPNPTYHGTRVSGIIGATTNNGPGLGSGIAGIAPNCRIMPVKVLNSWGFGSFFSIADGITYAADHGASVINLSLGGESGDSTGSIQAAVSHAFDKNCVVVAAAGNSGNGTNVNFPASISGIIAVGSINQSNALSSFSATGTQLDLVAPGEDIYSTVPSTVSATSSVRPGSGANLESGTSFSSPEVAGVAALIRSIRPTLSWSQVVQYIDFTATDLGPAGFDTNFGFGRLNAGAAVAAAQSGKTFTNNPVSLGDTFPYPNPFHPGNGQVVTISIPASLGNQGIEISIFSTAGEKIRTISGTNIWDGTNDDGSIAASGLYFYIAKTSAGQSKGKLTLIK